MKRKEGITSSKSFIKRGISGELDSIWKGLPVHCIDLIAIHKVVQSSNRVLPGDFCEEASMPEHNEFPNFKQAVFPHLDVAWNLARWLQERAAVR